MIYALIITKIKNPAGIRNPVVVELIKAEGSAGADLQNGIFDIPASGDDVKPLGGGLAPQ